MKDSDGSKRRIHRRDLHRGAAAASLALTAGALGIPKSFGQTSVGDNAIRAENAKPGTRDWLLTKTDITANEPVELWRSPRIEGYCSETSVSAGETLKVMVSTNPASEFSLEIFRTGYYGGDGGRSMKKSLGRSKRSRIRCSKNWRCLKKPFTEWGDLSFSQM